MTESSTKYDPGFRITGGCGFHVTFENDFTVSVQFGPGHYCANRSLKIGTDELAIGKDGSPNAEVAAWGPNGEFLDLSGNLPWWEGDDVRGYATPANVLELLTWAASQ